MNFYVFESTEGVRRFRTYFMMSAAERLAIGSPGFSWEEDFGRSSQAALGFPLRVSSIKADSVTTAAPSLSYLNHRGITEIKKVIRNLVFVQTQSHDLIKYLKLDFY